MNRSLRGRLTALFSVLVLSGAVVTLLVTSLTTRTQFDQYVLNADRRRAAALADSLARYYTDNGDWSGVAGLLSHPGRSGVPQEMRDMGGMMMESSARGGGSLQPGGRTPRDGGRIGPYGGQRYMLPVAPLERVALGDASGSLVVDTAPPGAPPIDAETLAHGYPVTVAGKTVGRVMVGSMIDRSLDPLQRQFIKNVFFGVILSSITVAILAAVFGTLFLGGIVRPLKALTLAADEIAANQGGSVPKSGRSNDRGDEVERLAQSFERMQVAIHREEESRKRLFRDVAHDLRTPVTLLQGEIEAMLDGIYETNPENIRSLLRETEIISRLIQDIQTLAALDAQELNLDRETVNPVEIVMDTVRAFRSIAESQGVNLLAETPADIPALRIDRARIMQVIGNLVQNALTHGAPLHTVTVKAEVGESTATEQPVVNISVIDDGRGIDPAELDRIFDRLFRGNGGGSRLAGTGLGLTIAKRIVEAHGGTLTVKSTPGSGAEFVVVLPASEV
ncbi:MAG TPA: HAMP domain-containing sensor histidine kinase [Spirochaetia bacterium]|nr:HAMP domain-containing sensor histidine kinase [Spirochaetia bacterium]